MAEEFSGRKRVEAERNAIARAEVNRQKWKRIFHEGAPDTGIEYQYAQSGLAEYEQGFQVDAGSICDFLRQRYAEHGGLVRVLDYGCGSGQALRDLYEANVAATSIDEDRHPIPIELKGVSVGDFRTEDEQATDRGMHIEYIDKKHPAYTPEPGSCDVVMTHLTLLHEYDPLRQLEKLYNALSPGGRLYFNLHRYALMRKFLRSIGEHNEDAQSKAYADTYRYINTLVESGIIFGPGNYITKNDVPLRLANLRRVHPLDEKGTGLYELVDISDK